MSHHLPAIIFLIPFLTAICLPVMGAKGVSGASPWHWRPHVPCALRP